MYLSSRFSCALAVLALVGSPAWARPDSTPSGPPQKGLELGKVSLDPVKPRVESPLRIGVEVENTYENAYRKVTVSLTVDGKLVSEQIVWGGLGRQDHKTLNFHWVPHLAGVHKLDLQLGGSAPSSTLHQEVEVLERSGARLETLQLQAPQRVTLGQEAVIKFVLENHGEAEAESVRVALQEGARRLSSLRVDSLKPGAKAQLSMRWMPDRVGPRLFHLVPETAGQGKSANVESATFTIEVVAQ